MARKIKRKISEKNAHRWAVITVTVVVACMAFVLNNVKTEAGRLSGKDRKPYKTG